MNTFRPFLFLMGIIIVAAIAISVYNQSFVETIRDCKVIELQQQQLINGDEGHMKTEIRYLVITDKETFICESSLINMKFNNSDVFWHLKKDRVYDFKVCGIGKTMITDYRNILNVVE